MKGFEKERNKTPNPLWVKLRFYILILLSTALILLLIINLDNAEHLVENILPAGISLTNAVIAYIVSKRKQGSRTYKQMMNNIKKWTIIRFIGMALFVFLPAEEDKQKMSFYSDIFLNHVGNGLNNHQIL